MRAELRKCAKCEHWICAGCRQKWMWMLMTDEWGADMCLRCLLLDPSVRARPWCMGKTHIVGMKCSFCFE